jgi:hypothetical protein
MPLDATGFGSDGSGSSNNQAMLIIPDYMTEHFEHAPSSCMVNLWVSAAIEVVAQKHGISVAQVYLTTPIEITTGHLDNYKDKIHVLGVIHNIDADVASPRRYIEKSIVGVDEVKEGPLRLTLPENGPWKIQSARVPDTVERLIAEKRNFELIFATPLFCLAISDAIPERSVLGEGEKIAVSLSFSAVNLMPFVFGPS